jgi:hypothetical protein
LRKPISNPLLGVNNNLYDPIRKFLTPPQGLPRTPGFAPVHPMGTSSCHLKGTVRTQEVRYDLRACRACQGMQRACSRPASSLKSPTPRNENRDEEESVGLLD